MYKFQNNMYFDLFNWQVVKKDGHTWIIFLNIFGQAQGFLGKL